MTQTRGAALADLPSSRRILALAGAILCAASGAGCGERPAPAAGAGFASPEAVAEEARAALRQDDYGRLMRTIVAEDRVKLARDAIKGAEIFAAMATAMKRDAADRPQQGLEQILAAHGLESGRSDAALAAADHGALIAQLRALTARLAEGQTLSRYFDGLEQPLEDLKSDGSRATATCGKSSLTFVKNEGGWFLRAP